MSRSRAPRPRSPYDTDEYEFHVGEQMPLSWKMLGSLLLVLVAGILLIWIFQAGYGRLAVVVALATGGVLLLVWLASSVRLILAWGSHQVAHWTLWTQTRQQRLRETQVDLSERQAHVDTERRRARAEQLKALASYVKAEAEAEHVRTSAARDWAALQAGLHYPSQHGYPIYVAPDSHGPTPRIMPTDHRVLHAPQNDTPALPTSQAPAVVGQLSLPEPMRDIDLLRGWDLRPDHIYLATGRGNQHLTCSLEGWGHIAHDARTGGGKTLLARLELAMMLKLGVDVILCNPHFAPIDKRGHDWRPIGFHLEHQGPVEIAPGVRVGRIVRKAEAIARLLEYLARTELDRRYDLQARGVFDWKALSIFLDEIPWLVHECPAIAAHLIILLQRGRAVDVRVLTNAQSFLVGNTGMKGGNGGRFDTVHFLGGNPRSGAVLLGMSERDLKLLIEQVQAEANQALGKGLGLLRNLERVPQAQPARVPFGTNDYQYYLLGRHDDWQLPEFRSLVPPSPMHPPKEAEQRYWTWDDHANVFASRDPHTRVVDAETDEAVVARTSERLAVRLPSPPHEAPPAAPVGAASGKRPKTYRISDADIPALLAAYKASGNVDQALTTLGRGVRYRKHAREILHAHGLHPST